MTVRDIGEEAQVAHLELTDRETAQKAMRSWPAAALLTSTPGGQAAYIDADLRDPETILANPVVAGTLDLNQPVALMLVAVLHFLVDAVAVAAACRTPAWRRRGQLVRRGRAQDGLTVRTSRSRRVARS